MKSSLYHFWCLPLYRDLWHMSVCPIFTNNEESRLPDCVRTFTSRFTSGCVKLSQLHVAWGQPECVLYHTVCRLVKILGTLYDCNQLFIEVELDTKNNKVQPLSIKSSLYRSWYLSLNHGPQHTSADLPVPFTQIHEGDRNLGSSQAASSYVSCSIDLNQNMNLYFNAPNVFMWNPLFSCNCVIRTI